MTPTKGKARHTKGPWYIEDSSQKVSARYNIIEAATGAVRAHVPARDVDGDKYARLICANPLLLKAVHGLIWLHNNRHNHADPKFLEFLDAAAEDAWDAIKLAEGE